MEIDLSRRVISGSQPYIGIIYEKSTFSGQKGAPKGPGRLSTSRAVTKIPFSPSLCLHTCAWPQELELSKKATLDLHLAVQYLKDFRAFLLTAGGPTRYGTWKGNSGSPNRTGGARVASVGIILAPGPLGISPSPSCSPL